MTSPAMRVIASCAFVILIRPSWLGPIKAFSSFTADNRVLLSGVYRTIVTRGWLQCLRACQAERHCVSYNYHKSSTANQKSCQLNSKVISECCADHVLLFAKGFVFHQLKPLQVLRKCPRQKGNWLTTKKVYKNCLEFLNAGGQGHASGIYTVDPDGSGAFDVYCDQTHGGGGWTVFQRRWDGSVDFFLPWSGYKSGFGNLTGEFWLGLDRIHRLTAKALKRELRIEIEEFDGKTTNATYLDFEVSSESEYFALHVENYSGNAGDSLRQHNGMPFTTYDEDNGDCDDNCAQIFHGAWWYADTRLGSNLNGRYYNHSAAFEQDGIVWLESNGYNASLKATEMKVRVSHN